MKKRIELLAPAGNLEKAKIALLYGADAVYVGGKKYSLRARASNFDITDIENLCSFAKKTNKKVYVTMNILPHDEDLINLSDLDLYLKSLENAGVSAIITSSLFIVRRAKEIAPKLERHISTQMSITNSKAIEYYKQESVSRVVLAREVSLCELNSIMPVDMEIEIFIHGGMCCSYSGRCVLSNFLTSRDANRGGCAHSCRWNYKLFEKNKKITKDNQYFNMGSKDMMTLKYIPDLIKLNVSSLKIEGRMKSAYYLATVIRSYRKAIDLYYQNGFISDIEQEELEKEINKAENRMTSDGFYRGNIGIDGTLYDDRSEHPTKEYIGYVLDYNKETKKAIIEQRNYFEIGDVVEFFGPSLENTRYKIKDIYSLDQKINVDVARHPLELLEIEIPFEVQKHNMLRKVK